MPFQVFVKSPHFSQHFWESPYCALLIDLYSSNLTCYFVELIGSYCRKSFYFFMFSIFTAFFANFPIGALLHLNSRPFHSKISLEFFLVDRFQSSNYNNNLRYSPNTVTVCSASWTRVIAPGNTDPFEIKEDLLTSAQGNFLQDGLRKLTRWLTAMPIYRRPSVQ